MIFGEPKGLIENENYILLAADIDKRGMVNRTLQIPRGCIVYRKTLKTPVVKC